MALPAGWCCKWGPRKPFKMIYLGLHSSLGSLGSWFYGGFAFIYRASVNCIVAGQGILVYNTVWYNKKGFTITSIFFSQRKDSLTQARYSFLQNNWMNISGQQIGKVLPACCIVFLLHILNVFKPPQPQLRCHSFLIAFEEKTVQSNIFARIALKGPSWWISEFE